MSDYSNSSHVGSLGVSVSFLSVVTGCLHCKVVRKQCCNSFHAPPVFSEGLSYKGQQNGSKMQLESCGCWSWAQADAPLHSPLNKDDVISAQRESNCINSTILRLELRPISFLMELKALPQKCLILGICRADPDLPFDTVIKSTDLCCLAWK